MYSEIKLHFNGVKSNSNSFFVREGEESDLLFSVNLGLKLILAIHLLLLCTTKPLCSFPFGNFSPFFI